MNPLNCPVQYCNLLYRKATWPTTAPSPRSAGGAGRKVTAWTSARSLRSASTAGRRVTRSVFTPQFLDILLLIFILRLSFSFKLIYVQSKLTWVETVLILTLYKICSQNFHKTIPWLSQWCCSSDCWLSWARQVPEMQGGRSPGVRLSQAHDLWEVRGGRSHGLESRAVFRLLLQGDAFIFWWTRMSPSRN